MAYLKLHAIVMTLAALAGAALLSGCQTTAGFGQDLEAAGSAIERSAERRSY